MQTEILGSIASMQAWARNEVMLPEFSENRKSLTSGIDKVFEAIDVAIPNVPVPEAMKLSRDADLFFEHLKREFIVPECADSAEDGCISCRMINFMSFYADRTRDPVILLKLSYLKTEGDRK